MSNAEATPTAPAKGGLAGMVVADSSISFVDGAEGILEYRGYDIRVLAENSTFEEVAYLLWRAHLPTTSELEEMKMKSRQCRYLPPEIVATLRDLPKTADPMAVLRSVVSLLAHYDPESEDMTPEAHGNKACRLVGQMASALAAFERLRKGEEPIKPRMDLDHAANFLWMLNGEDPDPLAAKALDQYLLLLAEHELNASTFTARVTASTGSDLHSAIVAGMAALKGPLHGRAVQEAMVQFLEIGSVENVEPWFEQARAQGQRVMGMGHRVYKVRDPPRRAADGEPQEDGRGERRRQVVQHRGQAGKGRHGRPLFPGSQPERQRGLLLGPVALLVGAAAGHLHFDVRTISRIAGWTAHVYEQQSNNRLIRPLSHYTGEHQLPYVPIEDRETDAQTQCCCFAK